MAWNKKKKSGGVQSLLDFLQRNWKMIIGLIVAYPILSFFFQKMQSIANDKQLEAINENPTLQSEALDDITDSVLYKDVARKVLHHFGFAYPLWDPRRWTENDEEAFYELKRCGPVVPFEVVQCYYLLSGSEKRNLEDDCAQLLPPDLLDRLNWE